MTAKNLPWIMVIIGVIIVIALANWLGVDLSGD